MRQSVRLGTIAGIPVGAHWSVLVIVMLVALVLADSVLPAAAPGASTAVYWSVALSAAVVFLVSLLAHELAHALVARRKGVPVAIVVDTGVIAGIITVDDLRRLVQLRHLQRVDPAAAVP